MIFLTVNDSYSGIYKSQVVDVVKLLRKLSEKKVWLVALVPFQNFFQDRKQIKKKISSAIVLPMLPSIRFWKWNSIILRLIFKFINKDAVIARGVFASYLAIKIAKGKYKVCYDGRGAFTKMLKEYNVIEDKKMVESIYECERQAVLKSDYRMSVSQALINYWGEEFNYTSNNHVIIPCTISEVFEKCHSPSKDILDQLGWNKEDIGIVYSGSSAGWQSFAFAIGILEEILENNQNVKLLFLSKEDESIKLLIDKYPKRVQQKWVKHHEVPSYLAACDYGIILRQNTITNKVASPVKFAEYLSQGLKVLCSPRIGDYSSFIVSKGCGLIVKEHVSLELNKVTEPEKEKNVMLAKSIFSKHSQSITDKYSGLISQLES